MEPWSRGTLVQWKIGPLGPLRVADMSSRAHLQVPQLLEERAKSDPAALAITSNEDSLTFGDLDRRSAWLAYQLIAADINPNSRVGLCVERSAAWVVGALAVLKTGAAYVALDPADPI